MWCDEEGVQPVWYSSPKSTIPAESWGVGGIQGSNVRVFYKISDQDSSKLLEACQNKENLKNNHRD